MYINKDNSLFVVKYYGLLFCFKKCVLCEDGKFEVIFIDFGEVLVCVKFIFYVMLGKK